MVSNDKAAARGCAAASETRTIRAPAGSLGRGGPWSVEAAFAARHTHVSASVCLHTYTYIYIHTYMCMCVHIHVCVCVCMYVLAYATTYPSDKRPSVSCCTPFRAPFQLPRQLGIVSELLFWVVAPSSQDPSPEIISRSI